MRGLRTVVLVLVGVIILGLTGAWLARGKLATAAMARIYDRVMGQDPYAGLADGLHVGLCGSGSPMSDPTRAGPCTVVLAGKKLFVVDAGAGGTKNLSLMNLPPARVNAVFLTHFHSDHIDGLGELMLQRWASGPNTSPLPIYGPTGVDQVVAGFQSAYELDSGYRIAHHGPVVVPPSGFGGVAHPFESRPDLPDVTLIDEPDLKVIAFPVHHNPVEPAVGYLFIYKGRRAVISGDTTASPRLEAAAKGADLLVHEGLAPNLVALQRKAALANGRGNLAAIFNDILTYHTTPEQAAGIAQRAGVKSLLFTHVIPPLPMRALEGPFLGKSREIYSGAIRVGHDGDLMSLPAGSTEIRYSNRLKTFR
ncbi:MBL fold metallo-hydrolase [Phenylobacterium sp.]|uniref:MBL fold metallo-hydrolase n=1 Tax=Phenylobacterium sp. TaxID=1871053 RepID=UPI00271879C4|nr:MBL fold metallo-hydrolase [Phenylobacterium sp.]MDO8378533.1 MBL fold metallo-hydrolase [Phenylobacterium sp.]